MKSREHQMRLQLLQEQSAHLQRRDPNLPALNGAMNSDVSAVLASKLMEGMWNHNPMDSEASQLFDANMIALLKSAANQTAQLQGSSVNMAALQHQLQSRNQQVDMKGAGAMQQRTMPTDPSALYGSAMMQSNSGLAASGPRYQSTPVKFRPTEAVDDISKPISNFITTTAIDGSSTNTE